MKNLFLKTIPIILVLGIMLSGCSKNDPKQTNKTSPSSTTKAATAAVSSSPKSSASATATPVASVATSPAASSAIGETDGYKNLKASSDDSFLAGGLFFGTFSTAVEYKDVTITKDGKTYVVDDFKDNAKSSAKWTTEVGTWNAAGGLLTQSDITIQDCRYGLNDFFADNYTLEFKGKKTDGAEGFYVGFGLKDDGLFCRLVLGGWGNTRNVIESNGTLNEKSDFIIDTDVWYTIKLVVGIDSIDCYMNGELILSATEVVSFLT